MGYMRHSAIVVIGWPEDVSEMHAFATGLGMTVTPVTTSPVNHYASFMVAPDGSKEGWNESAAGDRQRDILAKRLASPDCGLDWAELEFPEDRAVRIVRSSAENDEFNPFQAKNNALGSEQRDEGTLPPAEPLDHLSGEGSRESGE